MGVDGKRQEVTFTCPTCGGHNCEKLDELHDVFWSGYYRCTDCGETELNGNPICYSKAKFINKERACTVVNMERLKPDESSAR